MSNLPENRLALYRQLGPLRRLGGAAGTIGLGVGLVYAGRRIDTSTDPAIRDSDAFGFVSGTFKMGGCMAVLAGVLNALP